MVCVVCVCGVCECVGVCGGVHVAHPHVWCVCDACVCVCDVSCPLPDTMGSSYTISFWEDYFSEGSEATEADSQMMTH